jgi:hypothetical protein
MQLRVLIYVRGNDARSAQFPCELPLRPCQNSSEGAVFDQIRLTMEARLQGAVQKGRACRTDRNMLAQLGSSYASPYFPCIVARFRDHETVTLEA